MEKELLNILCKYPKENVYFFGLGNIYRNDDGFGIYMANRLMEAGFCSVDESENMDGAILDLCKVKEKKAALFFDAADFDGKSGDIKIYGIDNIEDIRKGYHKIPLKLYMKLLEHAGHHVWLCAIEPESLDYSESLDLTPVIKEKAENLINIITGCYL